MAQRSVCLYQGKCIGIETIYSVIDGKQINIPEKLSDLRIKSRNNELFCPCGCGANVILVAGEKNLREQHFRMKDGSESSNCHMQTEGKTSIDSKIVLKCWLDEVLKTQDIETRVPIQAVDDINRKYEFSFLSREKKVALSYFHESTNVSNEKMEILESNGKGIHLIYVTDASNSGCYGQYPENMIKIQHRQGYCLFLEEEDRDYESATLTVAVYKEDYDGLWVELVIASSKLNDFSIDRNGSLLLNGEFVNELLEKKITEFYKDLDETKKQQEEERRARIEKAQIEEQERQKNALLAAQRKLENEKKAKEEEEQKNKEKQKREADFAKNVKASLQQQEEKVYDQDGIQWLQCEYCGKVAKENKFFTYGGAGHINLGTCYDCQNRPEVKMQLEEKIRPKEKQDLNRCPMCGGMLLEKSGPFGAFIGCRNYPTCKYTRKLHH